MKLSGWGRYPLVETTAERPNAAEDVGPVLSRLTSVIAHGNCRAYGDAALNASRVLDMRRLNRLVAFDEETGLLVCEAGTLLCDLVDLLLPRGWFVPVTPGTRFVTIGGMVAADVHGKNHHKVGSFGDHLVWIDLVMADGRTMRCSPYENADIFNATIGGMGLTGAILRIAFTMTRVETDLISRRLLKADSLDQAMDLFQSNADATYSVAWIDCLATGGRLGRSLIMLGEHLPAAALPAARAGRAFDRSPRRRLSLPVNIPAFVLNRYAMAAFNALYHHRAHTGEGVAELDEYFYPLDAIGSWNRIYGRDGFLQYQFVLPMASSREGMHAILKRIAAAGCGSFLAVLKLFGPVAQRTGSLSFPREGYTLALDFPASISTLNLLIELDVMVADHGGRLYLAKDARSGAAMLAGYEELDAFRAMRARIDPTQRFSSLLSQRLGL